jgi:hypothetical protein
MQLARCNLGGLISSDKAALANAQSRRLRAPHLQQRQGSFPQICGLIPLRALRIGRLGGTRRDGSLVNSGPVPVSLKDWSWPKAEGQLSVYYAAKRTLTVICLSAVDNTQAPSLRDHLDESRNTMPAGPLR